MKIAVCDGNASDRRMLCAMLQNGFAERSMPMTAEPYDDAEDLLAEWQEECYEAIFLDVSDNETDAMNSARVLRTGGYAGRLILTASTASLAVDGYEVDADGFLIKPYRPERMIRLLDRLSRREREEGCLMISRRRTVVRVPYAEILFVESRNAKCIVHRQSGMTYTVYRRLDDMEAELCDERFLRCHQSYLVNLDHVVKADAAFELDSGDEVGIRQRELRRMRERFFQYQQRRRSDREQKLNLL